MMLVRSTSGYRIRWIFALSRLCHSSNAPVVCRYCHDSGIFKLHCGYIYIYINLRIKAISLKVKLEWATARSIGKWINGGHCSLDSLEILQGFGTRTLFFLLERRSVHAARSLGVLNHTGVPRLTPGPGPGGAEPRPAVSIRPESQTLYHCTTGPVFSYRNAPELLFATCKGRLINSVRRLRGDLPELHQPSAPEPSGSLFAFCRCAIELSNLACYLHEPSEPHQPSGTLRNFLSYALEPAAISSTTVHGTCERTSDGPGLLSKKSMTIWPTWWWHSACHVGTQWKQRPVIEHEPMQRPQRHPLLEEPSWWQLLPNPHVAIWLETYKMNLICKGATHGLLLPADGRRVWPPYHFSIDMKGMIRMMQVLAACARAATNHWCRGAVPAVTTSIGIG